MFDAVLSWRRAHDIVLERREEEKLPQVKRLAAPHGMLDARR